MMLEYNIAAVYGAGGGIVGAVARAFASEVPLPRRWADTRWRGCLSGDPAWTRSRVYEHVCAGAHLVDVARSERDGS
jgi:hypothetical protein